MDNQTRTTSKTVMFALPLYGSVHRLVYESHLMTVAWLANKGIVTKYGAVTNKMSLTTAENEIVRAALELEVDYIFWTEQDMVLPANCIWKLMQANKDVISGLYFLRGSSQPCIFKKINDGKEDFYHMPGMTFPKDEVFPVDCPGMGCVLMKTEVFRQMKEPWFNAIEAKHGSDIYFYSMLKQIGIQTYVDSSVLCGQIDEDSPKMYDINTYKEWVVKAKGGYLFEKEPVCQ